MKKAAFRRLLAVLMTGPGLWAAGVQAAPVLDLDLSGPLEFGPGTIRVATSTFHEYSAQELLRFGEYVLDGWPLPLQELAEGRTETLDKVFETLLLMKWCFDQADERGVTDDPAWQARKREIIEEAVAVAYRLNHRADYTDPTLAAAVRAEVDALAAARVGDRRYWFQAIYLDTSGDFLELGPGAEYDAVLARKRQVAARALEMLAQGEPWLRVSYYFSDFDRPEHVVGPVFSGERGVEENGLAPSVAQALIGLSTDERSGVVETRFGLAILRVDRVEAEPTSEIEAFRTREFQRRHRERLRAAEIAWLDEQARGRFEVEIHPERLANPVRDPELLLVRVASRDDPDLPPVEYAGRHFNEWLEGARLTDIVNVLEAEGGRENHLRNVVHRGYRVLLGLSEGLGSEPRVEQWAKLKWRALTAEEVMRQVSRERAMEKPYDGENLRDYYIDRQAAYREPGHAVVDYVRVFFERPDEPRVSDRGLAKKVTERVIGSLVEAATAGASLSDAVARLWDPADSPARTVAARAADLLGPESTVKPVEVEFRERAVLWEADLLRLGVTDAYLREDIVAAAPGDTFGPFHMWADRPGPFGGHDGHMWVRVHEATPPKVRTMEEVMDRLTGDFLAVQAEEARFEIQQDLIKRAGLSIDYERLSEFARQEETLNVY